MEAALPNSSQPRTAGNENTRVLKLVALLFMIVDHVGCVFFPGQLLLRLFGRIAFPLYAWCLVVGCEYTSDIRRYALRLLIGLVISQPFFVLALGEQWLNLNVFATLLLGLIAIYGIKVNRYGSAVLCPICVLLVPMFVSVDYDWRGVTFIMFLYAARKSRGALAAVFISFCLFWGTNTVSVAKLLGITTTVPGKTQVTVLLNAVTRIQFYAVLALPFVLIPMKKVKLSFPRMAAYAAYPAHLLVIWLIRLFVTRS